MIDFPSHQDDSALRRQILVALAAMFPDSGDWTIRETLKRRDGWVFKVSSAHLKRSVAAKVYRSALPAHESPGKMFHALDFYHARATDSPRLTVPQPCGVVESLNLIVMEWIHAPTLHQRLRRSRFSKKSRQREIELAAQWLRWFHEQLQISRENYASEAALFEYKRLLHSHLSMNQDFFADAPDLHQHLKTWKKLTANLGNFELDHAVVHHDFTPSNIFIAENTVTGFDLLAQDRRPITYDICRFLTHLGNSRILPVPAEELRKYGCAAADHQAFMEAYSPGMREIPTQIFLYLQFTEILRRWLSVARQHAKGKRLRRQIQISQLQRMARHLSTSLRAS